MEDLVKVMIGGKAKEYPRGTTYLQIIKNIKLNMKTILF